MKINSNHVEININQKMSFLDICYKLNFIPSKNICRGPNFQYLSMWPYLEVGLLHM